MAQVINTNVMSLNAQRNLNKTQSAMSTAVQRLSSGLRINSAKDDAAGLAISTNMTSQIRGLSVAIRNSNDGISLSQTAESGMDQITNNLQRMRELAVQSANGTLQDTDRDLIQKEVTELEAEVGRIISDTKFNGQALLDGVIAGAGGFDIQIGPNNGDKINMTIDDMSTLNAATAGTIKVDTQADANTAMDNLDLDLTALNGARATLGAVQNRFESVISNLTNYSENLQAARSRIIDTDFAETTAELTRTQILQQAGTAMVSQANSMPQSVLSLIG